ncbi:MAG TPA: serine hydrolase domain-containing protein [Bacteroidales bacterium]|nr:serine hydrolase domain-containing protein [Bacteroidales bacterium]
MKKILVAAFCLAALIIPSHAVNLTPEKQAEVRKAIDKLAESYNIPDFAIVIVNRDSALMTYEKNPENAGKNYLIGSCSKSFTALAIMKLVNEKIIDLDAPVKQYLPWFTMKNPEYAKKVTVRNLLNQKSGFRRENGFFDRRTATVSEFELKLTNYIRRIDVKSEPGKTFEYSNLNYVLLGLIVRHVTGHPYADYISQYVMPEAGMTDTWLTEKENNQHNLIQPYQYSIFMMPSKSRFYFYSDYILPAGYISSTINDIGSYLRYMLNRTVSDKGDTVLSAQNYDLLTGAGQSGYAMGWFRYKDDSIDIVNHSGLDENYASSFLFMPETGIGIGILSNINTMEFCARADQQIRSILLKGKPAVTPSFSMEKFMRWTACILPILILILLIYNMGRWIKNDFQAEFVPGWKPNVRLIIGVGLSLFLLFTVLGAFQMPLGKAIRFAPDIGWGLILIAALGVFSSLVRYFSNIPKYREE